MFGTFDSPDQRNLLDRTGQGIIGKGLDRPEAGLKVTGRATYAAEYRPENCADGVLVTATVAQGKILQIESEKIEALPGVLGIFTDKLMLRRPAQGTAGRAPAQDPRQIEYHGQPLALVVAETFEQAMHAAKALCITYERHHDVPYDPETAPSEPAEKPIILGDLDEAMANAAHKVDATYETAGHASAAMEPHASIASWQGDDLTIWGSFQMISHNVKELADALRIAPKRVRILSPYVGGGFGSKLGISHDAVAAALAAKALGRPVRVVLTRQQVFTTIMRRSETRQRLRLAADGDGRLTGLGHEAWVSNLPQESFAEPVTQATQFLYGGENRKLCVNIARISRLTAGSVRAPGEAVGMQALEAAMDELAERAGLDPIELRKRNLPSSEPGKDRPYSSRMLAEALDQGAAAFGWHERQPKPCMTREGEWWIGLGVASAARVNMLMPAAARVRLEPDGSLLVQSDQTDIGTGSYAILGQIAGEMLGVPIERVRVELGDSELPSGAGSGGSFGASSTGSAVFRACEAIRDRLAHRLGARSDRLDLRNGIASSGERSAPVAELLRGYALEEIGRIKPGKTQIDYAQASYGAFFCEVAVNAFTAETRIRRLLGVFGFGRVLNQKTARSQCLGGMVWGIGSALSEELSFDLRDGRLMNHDLEQYHLPVHADIPDLDVILLEERDTAASPLQAKGVGELGICGTAGAIANAVYNACGVRAYSFPITPDRLIDRLPEPLT
ncbi:xanthine dehydrogenase family protein molybdopterin-binding subunit [Paracoccus litorisediminis]|uniref:Molybdopterin-dependent oxidoreductase n=1 Tax=Paracoccus litorisediminis TaxID=2006130 RepID=A0A844HUD3_9RHOB|nr:xanthine dehydrogenase family protein molybdopterin-binding subunit [Paracoccus litorisediminis]MTH61875.1 molybdopterin-dependent oxidoreductase [Paracoccus litorisediminis]